MQQNYINYINPFSTTKPWKWSYRPFLNLPCSFMNVFVQSNTSTRTLPTQNRAFIFKILMFLCFCISALLHLRVSRNSRCCCFKVINVSFFVHRRLWIFACSKQRVIGPPRIQLSVHLLPTKINIKASHKATLVGAGSVSIRIRNFLKGDIDLLILGF